MLKPLAARRAGFTIVELLVVIVVIAILASISIVSYTNIQSRANDAVVQGDLKNIGQQFMIYQATEGSLPTSSTHFNSMELKVSRGSYGNGYSSNGYNMAYCRDTVNIGEFAIVAASKSGNVYVFNDGTVSQGVGPLKTLTVTCSDNGIDNAQGSGTNWFYHSGAWQAWIGW